MSYIKKLRERVGNDLIQVPGVAALIRDEQGRLLVVKKAKDGSWSLPTGAIEPGERPSEAIKRRVLEETGFEVVPSRVAGIFGGSAFKFIYPNGDQVEYLVVLIDCRIVNRVSGAGSEVSEMKYFSQADLPALGLPYPKSVLFGLMGDCFLN